MWRTLVINSAERIKVKDSWITVETETGEERIPVNELYSAGIYQKIKEGIRKIPQILNKRRLFYDAVFRLYQNRKKS